MVKKTSETVMDSWGLLAMLEDQAGADAVGNLLKEASLTRVRLHMCLVNWGEVLYVTERRSGRVKRDEVEHLMDRMPIALVEVDRPLVCEAARIKTKTGLPYADCFAAGLAALRKARLVTGDRDFEAVESFIPILWLG